MADPEKEKLVTPEGEGDVTPEDKAWQDAARSIEAAAPTKRGQEVEGQTPESGLVRINEIMGQLEAEVGRSLENLDARNSGMLGAQLEELLKKVQARSKVNPYPSRSSR